MVTRWGAALWVGAAGGAAAATIDFDDLTNGTQVVDQYQPLGASFVDLRAHLLEPAFEEKHAMRV